MTERILGALVIAMAASFLGCVGVGQPSPPIRHWVLSSLPGIPEIVEGDRSVAVGPIELPVQLDRSNVVLLEGANRLLVLPLDQWGEPLESGIARVIAENLTLSIPGLKGATFPWTGGGQTDAQLLLFVTRLDLRRGKAVELIVTWLLSFPGEAEARVVRTFSHREPVDSDKVEAMVAALSRSLEQLTIDVIPTIEREVPIRPRAGPGAADDRVPLDEGPLRLRAASRQ